MGHRNLFQVTLKIKIRGAFKILSNYFKNNTRTPREFCKLLQRHDAIDHGTLRFVSNYFKTKTRDPNDPWKLLKKNTKGSRDSFKILQKQDTMSLQDAFKLGTLKARQGIPEILLNKILQK